MSVKRDCKNALTRRRACGMLLSGALAGRAAAEDLPVADASMSVGGGGVTVLVGGSTHGTASAYAAMLAPQLAPQLLGPARQGAGDTVALLQAGGLDGVTAANQFEARANPDGSTALMIPGTAALAWLAGDPRVHFDAGLWVPALAAVAPAVLVGRTRLQDLRIGAPVRLAASGPAGRELPALLGLEMLRLQAEPVFDIRLDVDKEAALRDGAVDAVLLTGADVPARLSALQAAGFSALFALDGSDRDNPRDPALPHIATLGEIVERTRGHAPAGQLVPAYRASSAAAQLEAALVLPPLAPAGVVARWRAACGVASSAASVQEALSVRSLRSVTAPTCVGAVSAVLAGQTALLDLHRFLADRYNWRPA